MFEEIQYYGDHHNDHHHGDPMGYRAKQSETGRTANLVRNKQFSRDFRLKIAQNSPKLGIFDHSKLQKVAETVENQSKPVFSSVSKRRRLESQINRMLDARLPGKNHNDVMSKWLQTLETTSPDEYGLMVPELAASIREHLDEMLGEPNGGKND
ncbi:hypothetical protein B9Z55_028506 [Caenorhabditis nigoni]|uniref:Uncharacterized protein n=1 Tax=Caenorhabditis nigoni TaxID=1611254 RepID=A0A2G5SBI2_9PELO|nr:hypothetical protein B9Z55_028506 [Caenorhabditis nigoni]